MNNEKEFTVSIVWGEFTEYVPMSYSFKTQAELDAFLFGVEEAHGCGVMDYIVHTKGKDQKFTLKEFGYDECNLSSAFLKEWAKYMETNHEN